ncbi:cytochrome o ubiquinol oxidase subunit III, partial [Pseudomonas sp. NPDC089569]
MSNLVTNAGHTHVDGHGHDDHHHDSGEMTVFGFWLYLMTDCILFASIFAAYAVLVNNVAGGPSGHDIFELPYVLGETALLLFSSITYGFAMLAFFRGNKTQVLG